MNKCKKVFMALLFLGSVVGCKPEEDPNNGENDLSDNHEYVNLGLPSGTLWATCNVGADTPEGFGDYFAWGETRTKTTFSWGNYRYCNGSLEEITKYCDNPYYGYEGFFDGKCTLQSIDDAATCNWGEGWRTPSYEQWEELCQNTTITLSMKNGVNGRLFTAPNGNSIFLPAAGHWMEDDEIYIYNEGVYGVVGFYWSKNLDIEHYSHCAQCFIFQPEYYHYYLNEDHGIGITWRCRGLPIRPVRSGYSY